MSYKDVIGQKRLVELVLIKDFYTLYIHILSFVLLALTLKTLYQSESIFWMVHQKIETTFC